MCAGISFALAPALAHPADWLVQYGTSTIDTVNAVAADGVDVFAAGNTGGVMAGEHAGGQDVYVRAFDSQGRIHWTRQFGTIGNDSVPTGALAAKDRRIVVGGAVGNALPGQVWRGGDDAFVRAYDSDGSELWTLQFGNPEDQVVRSIAVAPDGSIALAGQTTGQLAGDPASGLRDAFVALLNADGTIRWVRQFGTTATDEAIGLTLSDDSIYVTGTTNGVLPGNVAAGDFDNFVARLDLAGQFVWMLQFGTPVFDAAWKVALVRDTLILGGNTSGAYPGNLSLGLLDAFVAGIQTDGRVLWVHQFGSAGNDLTFGVDADEEGPVAVGRIDGLLPPAAQDPTVDAFVARFDVEGHLLWMQRFGTDNLDNAQGVALDKKNIYIGGVTVGAFPGTFNAGLRDGYVMRLRKP